MVTQFDKLIDLDAIQGFSNIGNEIYCNALISSEL